MKLYNMILNILLVILVVSSCVQVKYVSLVHEALAAKVTEVGLKNQK